MPAPLELWLVRHAKAPSADEFNGSDADRPLDPDGAKKFTEFAEWVAEKTTIPYSILTSPWLRARKTAELLAAAGGIPLTAIVNVPQLAPGGDMTTMMRILRDQPGPRLAMVFHEPELSQFLNLLLGGGQVEWAKGGIIRVDFEEDVTAGAGAMKWYVRRKLA